MAVNRKFYCLHLKHEYRGVAQLVERVVWDHQAAGSSPVTPTKKTQQKDAPTKSLDFQGFSLSLGAKNNNVIP